MGGEQPSPDDVFQVVAVTNLEEPQARILLKVCWRNIPYESIH